MELREYSEELQEVSVEQLQEHSEELRPVMAPQIRR